MPANELSLHPDGKSQLGFGSAGLTSMRSYGQVKRLLNTAFEAGITHFDTAPLYGQGYSEQIIGEFIKNKRDKITLATKFGLGQTPNFRIPFRLALPLNYYKKKLRGQMFMPSGEEHLLEYRNIPLQGIRDSLENSLRSLKTTYLDYFFIHEGIPSFLKDDARTFLLDQKKKGTIRFLGIATGSLNLRRLGKEEITDWDVLQYESGPLSNSADIRTLFPDKIHFFHSCLKHISKFEKTGLQEEEKAGFILAQQVKTNPTGKIIFSTRRRQVLKGNLSSFDVYYNQ